MTAPSSPVALLDQLDELRAKAAPGPWEVDGTAGPSIGAAILQPEGHSEVPVVGLDCGVAREADAALIVAAVNAVGPLTAAVRAVLDEHRPMANSPGRQPACPDCLGGIYATDPDAVRECGCWGLATPVCSSCCDQPSRRRYPLLWPCPTVAAVTAALSVTP